MGDPQHTVTHYRNLAGLVGLPVDAPSQEDQAAYTPAALEALAMAGGGAAGQAISAGAEAALKQLGRCYRTRVPLLSR